MLRQKNCFWVKPFPHIMKSVIIIGLLLNFIQLTAAFSLNLLFSILTFLQGLTASVLCVLVVAMDKSSTLHQITTTREASNLSQQLQIQSLTSHRNYTATNSIKHSQVGILPYKCSYFLATLHIILLYQQVLFQYLNASANHQSFSERYKR